MTLCRQVSNFQRIVQFHFQSQAVQVCHLLQCFTLRRGTTFLQNIRNCLHNAVSLLVRFEASFTPLCKTSNLSSHLALTSSYQYDVRINMIIQLSPSDTVLIFIPMYILYFLYVIIFSVTYSMASCHILRLG